MAGSFANVTETDLLDKEFGAVNYTPPATHYVGLSSTDPGESGAGATEPAVGDYARVSYTNNGTNWPTANPKVNANPIAFPPAVAPGWGLMKYWMIFDASTAGNMRSYGRLQGPPKVVTVDASTDVFTSAAHGFVDGTPVFLENADGAAPGGITAGTTYYIRDQATNTFKLAATVGGSAINVTDAGSGTNTVSEDRATQVNNGTTVTIPASGINVSLT